MLVNIVKGVHSEYSQNMYVLSARLHTKSCILKSKNTGFSTVTPLFQNLDYKLANKAAVDKKE